MSRMFVGSVCLVIFTRPRQALFGFVTDVIREHLLSRVWYSGEAFETDISKNVPTYQPHSGENHDLYIRN